MKIVKITIFNTKFTENRFSLSIVYRTRFYINLITPFVLPTQLFTYNRVTPVSSISSSLIFFYFTFGNARTWIIWSLKCSASCTLVCAHYMYLKIMCKWNWKKSVSECFFLLSTSHEKKKNQHIFIKSLCYICRIVPRPNRFMAGFSNF